MNDPDRWSDSSGESLSDRFRQQRLRDSSLQNPTSRGSSPRSLRGSFRRNFGGFSHRRSRDSSGSGVDSGRLFEKEKGLTKTPDVIDFVKLNQDDIKRGLKKKAGGTVTIRLSDSPAKDFKTLKEACRLFSFKHACLQYVSSPGLSLFTFLADLILKSFRRCR